MAPPKTDRDVDSDGFPIRELGDATPLLSKKAEQTPATARGGPERAVRFDGVWIAFRETLAVALGSLANSIVDHAVLYLGVSAEDLPDGAFGVTLEVVGCHLGGDEGEQGQYQDAKKKISDQSDDRF